MYKQLTILAAAIFSVFNSTNTIAQSTTAITVASPDKKLLVKVGVETGHAYYTISANNKVVLRPSKLGVVRDDENFNDNLKITNASAVESVKDSYELFSGKKRFCNYTANKRIIHLANNKGRKADIIFQVSNDGVAFRYYFPEHSTDVKKITQEFTSFHFNTSVRSFLQPIAVAKTGWEQTNPSYEEHYKQNISSDTPSPTGAGWVYPALFNDNNTWVLITEASLDSYYCATRLQSTSPDAEYKIGFPDPREVFTGGGLLPESRLPFYSPWRVITIGSLKTIAESTLGTDVAKPTIALDKSFIKPGKSSWSWINSKDDFIVYDEQKKYIDYAADMHWQYCLIDADWDKKIGYDKVKELAQYAATKNVGILLWYNSSGAWNTVKYSPKSKLLTHEDRVKEFSRLKEMGIKGIKIDFFGGDGQSMIKYYIDILNDAAKFGLLTNFHGATLPRGWSRTYPHLLTTEAIRGFEMITFNQFDADAEANHSAMLPFTRNAFDPMDFTPMNLYKIQTRVKRQTTSAFELATSVLFISGIQHYAESPEGMSHEPEDIKQFLRDLPVRWDDVKFIDGYPGKHVVIARKSGNKWYIAGINGEKTEKSLQVNLSSFNKKKVTYITDGAEPLTFTTETIPATNKQVTLKPNGGFVIVLE
jgi:alpha-glucosidase